MKLMKYSDVLTLAKDKLKEVMAPIRAREMRIKAELEVARIEGQIAEKEQVIQDAVSKYPLEFDTVLESLDELDLLKRRRDQFNSLITDLFGE